MSWMAGLDDEDYDDSKALKESQSAEWREQYEWCCRRCIGFMNFVFFLAEIDILIPLLSFRPRTH